MIQSKTSLVFILSLLLGLKSAFALTFWTTEVEKDRVRVIQELVDKFQKENPDIEVKVVPVEENQVLTKLAPLFLTGKTPDIIEIGLEVAWDLVEGGALNTELSTSLIQSIGEDRFFNSALKIVSKGEKFIAVPMHTWIQGIWFRKDIFDSLNLKPPNSWATLLEAARKLHKPEKKFYGIVFGTKKDAYTYQCFSSFLLSNAVKIVDKSGKIKIATSEFASSLDFYKKLNEYTPPGAETWRDARDLFLQGRVGMIFYSTYIMDDIAFSKKKLPVDFSPYLIEKDTATYGQIVSLAIFKKEKNQPQVEKFVKFLFEPDNYIKFLHIAPGGMFPVLKDVVSMKEFLNDPLNIYKTFGDEFKEILKGIKKIRIPGSENPEFLPEVGKLFKQKIIQEIITQVIYYNKDIEKILEEYQGKI